MLIGERMSHPVITLQPNTPITEALNLFRREQIRRAPIIKNDRLVGIVSSHDLLHASPSQATSLSIWELNYLLAKITVEDVMTDAVITVEADTPIEEAARIMVDNKIGGLPVMESGKLVGIITETDLFKIFLELMGARQLGVRVTALVPDKPGELAELSRAISDSGGNFIAFGQFEGENPTNRLVTFKVDQLTPEQVKEIIQPVIEELIDIRSCC